MPVEDQLARAARVARRALRLRCPRCGETPLFRGWFAMAPECRFCGLRYERAQGYFVGAIYINYGVTTVIAVGGYFILWSRAGISTAAQFAIWIPFLVAFPLWFFRYSRSLWLALEYFVNPEQ
ncbi:MAG: hypothetical protein AUH29_12575 [Candidatus Rokubacteria bacterium 13_1_40CM_69_27]|nr:MAG: hypothetical protein AUH29_12575 [Candidatus Rokubacteria bacterium 13_1_40CM_69_27]OLC33773.1 MAG: hypothetical protein AUH81_13370 [Candidatus Rokubacteria bacterium 13_1_40CM_4_69_5]OLE39349.1 MAG: hypothetical protein AUG00_02495 [Candidatus Rokubacteria bacterium 13_1_20CM_2_70_7]